MKTIWEKSKSSRKVQLNRPDSEKIADKNLKCVESEESPFNQSSLETSLVQGLKTQNHGQIITIFIGFKSMPN